MFGKILSGLLLGYFVTSSAIASVVYDGSISGQVSVTASNVDTGIQTYNSGVQTSPHGGSIAIGQAYLEALEAGGIVGVRVYYKAQASSSLNITNTSTTLNASFDTFLDGSNPNAGSSGGGTSNVTFVYTFTLDTAYDYDLSATFSALFNPQFVYFELTKTGLGSPIFYIDAYDTTPISSTGSLTAGNYQLKMVVDVKSASDYSRATGDFSFNLTATDSDNDGIVDFAEQNLSLVDSDADGIDDVIDVDSTGGLDLNADGIDDRFPTDTDGDGTPDYLDTDSDNDGVADSVEGVSDTDGDFIPDYIDAANGDGLSTTIAGSGDSDNDGISDVDECASGIPCPDTDGDGTPDYMDAVNIDGPLANADGDALLNYLDPDSDNDSIPDVVEDPDLDNDANPMTSPLDTDLDGIPDYVDTDSDGDGRSDSAESGSSGNDTDGDNIDDSYDVDVTGGTDNNSDGIDDDVTPRDSNTNGTPDYLEYNVSPSATGNGGGSFDLWLMMLLLVGIASRTLKLEGSDRFQD